MRTGVVSQYGERLIDVEVLTFGDDAFGLLVTTRAVESVVELALTTLGFESAAVLENGNGAMSASAWPATGRRPQFPCPRRGRG